MTKNSKILKFRFWNGDKFLYSNDCDGIWGLHLSTFFEWVGDITDGTDGISQFICLKDCNDIEIYEHDIVKIVGIGKGNAFSIIGYVDYDITYAGYVLRYKVNGNDSVISLTGGETRLEIIGHMYQNNDILSESTI